MPLRHLAIAGSITFRKPLFDVTKVWHFVHISTFELICLVVVSPQKQAPHT